jgi:hypothetical protein
VSEIKILMARSDIGDAPGTRRLLRAVLEPICRVVARWDRLLSEEVEIGDAAGVAVSCRSAALQGAISLLPI